MGNGDGDNGDAILILDPAAGSIITDNRAEFRNGDGDGEGTRCLVCGTGLLVLLLWGFGLRQWRMEKDLLYLLPAARATVHVYLPIGGRTMGNGANGWSNDS